MALVFLLGTVGLSSLDVIAFHGPGADRGNTAPHFESQGTRCGHADRCVLTVLSSGPHSAVPHGAPHRVAADLDSLRPALAHQGPILRSFAARFQPRAPPSFLA